MDTPTDASANGKKNNRDGDADEVVDRPQKKKKSRPDDDDDEEEDDEKTEEEVVEQAVPQKWTEQKTIWSYTEGEPTLNRATCGPENEQSGVVEWIVSMGNYMSFLLNNIAQEEALDINIENGICNSEFYRHIYRFDPTNPYRLYVGGNERNEKMSPTINVYNDIRLITRIENDYESGYVPDRIMKIPSDVMGTIDDFRLSPDGQKLIVLRIHRCNGCDYKLSVLDAYDDNDYVPVQDTKEERIKRRFTYPPFHFRPVLQEWDLGEGSFSDWKTFRGEVANPIFPLYDSYRKTFKFVTWSEINTQQNRSSSWFRTFVHSPLAGLTSIIGEGQVDGEVSSSTETIEMSIDEYAVDHAIHDPTISPISNKSKKIYACMDTKGGFMLYQDGILKRRITSGEIASTPPPPRKQPARKSAATTASSSDDDDDDDDSEPQSERISKGVFSRNGKVFALAHDLDDPDKTGSQGARIEYFGVDRMLTKTNDGDDGDNKKEQQENRSDFLLATQELPADIAYIDDLKFINKYNIIVALNTYYYTGRAPPLTFHVPSNAVL